jgi:hypothetical protein
VDNVWMGGIIVWIKGWNTPWARYPRLGCNISIISLWISYK